MEVIFVNDGSEDSTLAIIKDYVSKMDFDVRIFSGEWRGLGPTRNVIVNNARGRYIIWVDGDMILPIDHTSKQVELMKQNPKVAIAGASMGLRAQTGLVAFLDNLGYVAYRLKFGEKSSNLPGTAGAIYRVEAIKQVGGFDKDITGSWEDIDVAYRVKCAGWLVVRNKALVYPRFKETWNGLWKKYLWYGYGAHYVFHKKKGIISLPKTSPPVTFFVGVICSLTAYKLIRRKIVFFIPFHFVFTNIAWWLGFFKSHFKGYGHAREQGY